MSDIWTATCTRQGGPCTCLQEGRPGRGILAAMPREELVYNTQGPNTQWGQRRGKGWVVGNSRKGGWSSSTQGLTGGLHLTEWNRQPLRGDSKTLVLILSFRKEKSIKVFKTDIHHAYSDFSRLTWGACIAVLFDRQMQNPRIWGWVCYELYLNLTIKCLTCTKYKGGSKYTKNV